MNTSGEWPGELTIRTSWSKATARPWNADLPYGYLRLIRGSSAFIHNASKVVLDHDLELVASPPLAAGSDGAWVRAGYEPFLTLHLYRRSLVGNVVGPDVDVREVRPDFARLYAVDRLSFDPLWRMDPLGLRESHRATTRAAVLEIDAADALAGFVIVGVSGVTGYLQRIAVDPVHRRAGHGRQLVRAALEWAARHGAASMLLNTQPENDGAAALYRAEGFARAPGDLRVLKFTG